jgi:hypothetical protein
MKKSIIISICFAPTLIYSETNWSQREVYSIDCDDKDGQVIFKFKQECNIENEQSQQNHYTFPLYHEQEAEPTTAVRQPSSWFSINDIVTPASISCAGALIIALYYFKSKLTLYSLSKACIQNAFWSLWNTATKQNDLLYNSQEQDTALLSAILQTYRTDKHAVAISRFLQDVEAEMYLLNSYINEASNAQSGPLYFAMPDLKQDILEAQARLAKLAYLKQKVLYWMAHGTATERASQPNGYA